MNPNRITITVGHAEHRHITKTDRIDAEVIAEFGRAHVHRLPSLELPDERHATMRLLLGRDEDLRWNSLFLAAFVAARKRCDIIWAVLTNRTPYKTSETPLTT